MGASGRISARSFGVAHGAALAALALLGVLSLALPGAARAQEQALPPGGIPVTNDLVARSCSRCHAQGDDGLMSRISYLRKTPEGWSQSIRRMVSLNGLSLDPADAREIVRYLSNRHGIAPEELRPALYEVERRHLTERPEMPEIVRNTCTACHSLGRIATQRRTAGEWELLTATHRGLYPLIDRQVFRRGSIPEEEGDFEFPMDAAAARLASTYPLHTTEWADWSRNMRPARLDGTWAVRGYELGRGAFFGTVTVEPLEGRPDEFSTTTRYVFPAEGTEVVRGGEGLVYTGYQWRGRSIGQGGEHAELREVMFVERDWRTMHGRWYTGAYDEVGQDVRLERVDGGPVVLGTYPDRVRAGTEATLTLYGVGLPNTLGAADVDLGAGVEVLGVSDVQGERATVRVRVAADAADGARDVLVPGARTGRALVVYGQVDYIRVEPHPALAHTGGVIRAPGQARFEAVGYTAGADGRPGNDDDVRIGAMPATWSLVEYPRTYDDDDVEFVGTIDDRGRFMPALDGPNPERSGNRNNIGEVWVAAEYVPEGAEAGAAPLRARGYLVVSPPVYMDWDGQTNTLQATEQDGGRN